MNYMAICRSTIGANSWMLDFDVASDKMAVDYASRVIKDFVNVPWFMGLDLYAEPHTDSERFLAHITMQPSEPVIKVRAVD